MSSISAAVSSAISGSWSSMPSTGTPCTLRAAQVRVVVEQSDRPIAVLAREIAHQRFARPAGAEHEHALAGWPRIRSKRLSFQ